MVYRAFGVDGPLARLHVIVYTTLDMQALTSRQKNILDFVKQEMADRGYPPTLVEIGNRFKIKSPNGVRGHLLALEAKGYLKREADGMSRALRVVGVQAKGSVPILGIIRAGAPLLAEENFSGRLDLGSEFSEEGGQFALEVRGDSMKDDGILEGDYVVVDSKAEVAHGGIGVVLVDDEATVKRVFLKGKILKLQPANRKYKTLVLDLSRVVAQLVGPVVAVVRLSFGKPKRIPR